jgi:hypothetical protein
VDEIIKVKFHPRLSHKGHAVVDGVLVGAGLLWPLEPACSFCGWNGFPSRLPLLYTAFFFFAQLAI